VVVVGRNDNHGYNLGKRVANSLNSISMRLSEGDELIFVDWNTPRPFPPMPVSIIDDLTEETKSFLRIITVDEKIHNRVKGTSNKKILEPIARNVGIRRALESNHWILSTNTDIIFVGEETLKFRDVVSNLDERLWQSFRYEIPEYVWELFDKRDPILTNQRLCNLRKNFPMRLKLTTHPDSRIDSSLIFADAIGDFQLASREHWFKVGAFPEDMLDGWHVDSRLAHQMITETKIESVILGESFGIETYHQNHLRSLTHFHINSEMNDESLIIRPYKNAPTWGLSDVKLVENGPDDFKIPVPALSEPDINEPIVMNLQEMHKHVYYDVARTMFFLNDELRSLNPGESLMVMSANTLLCTKIKDQIGSLGVNLDVFDHISDLNIVKDKLSKSDLVVIDFGVDFSDPNPQSTLLKAGGLALRIDEISRSMVPGTRVALIRSQNWATRTIVSHFFSVPLFNNYSSLLTGVKRIETKKIHGLQLHILKSGIKSDYEIESDFLGFEQTLFRTLKKHMPLQLKSLIKKHIFS